MDFKQKERLLYKMLRIRRTEELLADRYTEQEMRCPMHLCIGQEAVAVGVCENLETSDRVFSNHRAHGHYLAKGGDLKAMIAELYGRATGCCGGRGGSMHLIDLDAGFMGATPIVGGTVPLAVGSAWKSNLLQDDAVTVVFFGDGCFEEGVMHESMNFAALHALPVVFVCENNLFSVYTHIDDRQPSRQIYKIAEAHGLDSCQGNGSSVIEVHQKSEAAIRRARAGRGPQFLEFDVYRWREHCGPNFDNELNYRSSEDISLGQSKCPIENLKSELYSVNALNENHIAVFENEILSELHAAFKFACESPSGDLASASMKVFSA